MKNNAAKALRMLENTKSVSERASTYFTSIKRDLYDEVIKDKERAIEIKEDKIFDLSDFNLSTDYNKGMQRMTKEECKNRFIQILNLKAEIALQKLELQTYKEEFVDLFGEEEAEEKGA
jgi:hypothetical protein